MKIKDTMFEHDGKIIHHKLHDFNREMEQVKRIKESGAGQTGDYRLVGRLPAALIGEWIKEAGITWDDTHEIQEIIKRKMMSGDFDKFRVWEGTY